MNRKVFVAALVVAGAWARPGSAQDAARSSTSNGGATRAVCSGTLDADLVVRCALAASPEVRNARAELDATAGRRTTAGVWLPSNPTLGGTVSNRHRPAPEEASVINWSVALSQELEISGQRGARIEAADGEAAVAARRVAVAEQEVAAGALTAFYEAAAAQETLRFAVTLAQSAQALAAYAEGRAKEAVVAGVEADVARAEATRIGLLRFEAERRLAESRAALAALLDSDPRTLAVPAKLPSPTPAELPPGSLEDAALRLRGEVATAEIERQVLERRLALVRRERVPNPILSVFAAKEEINDRILGVGLSFPIPLPGPVGRSRAGEITETLAQIRAAEASTDLVRRRVRLEVARAQALFRAREQAADLFTADQLARARADLAALRDAIAARQLSLREGLQWQRSLIELLDADIGARLGRALAWVELRRIVGLPLGSKEGERR